MVKYAKLNRDQVSVYIDEFERGAVLGSPKYHVFEYVTLLIVHIFWILSLPFTWCFSFKIIRQYEKCMIFRLGRLLPLKEPGLTYIIPFVDKYLRVDMRTKAFNVPPLQIYTIDNGVVKIGADVQYRIVDPMLCYGLIKDVNHTLRVTAQAALNNTLSGKRLMEIENDKQYIGIILQTTVNQAVVSWGIEIGRFELCQSFVIKSPKDNGGPASNQDPAEHVMGLLQQMMSPAKTNSTATGSAQMSNLSIDDLFQLTNTVIDRDLVNKVEASFLIRVIAESETLWFLDLKKYPGSCKSGKPSSTPDITLKMTEGDLKMMFYGQLSPRDAYLDSRLTIEGDLQTALKLEHVVTKVMNIGNNSTVSDISGFEGFDDIIHL